MSTRPVASTDSNKRIKAINFNAIGALQDFDTYLYGDKVDEKKDAMHVSLLAKMRNYRPSGVCSFFYSSSLSFNGYFLFLVVSIDFSRFLKIDNFRVESTSKFRPM